MTIHFAVNPSDTYFVSTLTGKVRDTDLVEAYRDFLDSGPWHAGLMELVDLEGADLSEVTADGLRKLTEVMTSSLDAENATVATAIYAPHDLPFGLARMYQAFADESPESVRVFRDLDEARTWIEDRDPPAVEE